jgi:hypothetical protein
MNALGRVSYSLGFSEMEMGKTKKKKEGKRKKKEENSNLSYRS